MECLSPLQGWGQGSLDGYLEERHGGQVRVGVGQLDITLRNE